MIIHEIQKLLKNMSKEEEIRILLSYEKNGGVSIPYGAEVTETDGYIKVQPTTPKMKREEDTIAVDSEKEHPFYFREEDIKVINVTEKEEDGADSFLKALLSTMGD